MPHDSDDEPVDLPKMFNVMSTQAAQQGFASIASMFAKQATEDFTPYMPEEMLIARQKLLEEAEALLKQAKEKLLKTGIRPLSDDAERLELKVHYEVKRGVADAAR